LEIILLFLERIKVVNKYYVVPGEIDELIQWFCRGGREVDAVDESDARKNETSNANY
jgi:hypothetical protein